LPTSGTRQSLRAACLPPEHASAKYFSVPDHARNFGTIPNSPKVPRNIFPCRSKECSADCQPSQAATKKRVEGDHAKAAAKSCEPPAVSLGTDSAILGVCN